MRREAACDDDVIIGFFVRLGVLLQVMGFLSGWIAESRLCVAGFLGWSLTMGGFDLWLTALYAEPPPPLEEGASRWQRLRHGIWKAWNPPPHENKARLRKLWEVRYTMSTLTAIVALMLVIHYASPDPKVASFPAACPPAKRLACSRVASSDVHAAGGLQPLRLLTSVPDAQAACEGWVTAWGRGAVLTASPGFVHARMVSRFWSFADDLFVQLQCDKHNVTVVEVQGQSRLGRSDFGVNTRRNQRLFTALQQAELPEGSCAGT